MTKPQYLTLSKRTIDRLSVDGNDAVFWDQGYFTLVSGGANPRRSGYRRRNPTPYSGPVSDYASLIRPTRGRNVA